MKLEFYSTICLYNQSIISKPGMVNSYGNSHCIYILNIHNNAVHPNVNGEHLTDCGEYTCNHTYYKCPGFYCIPWQYVCNNRIDCPGGLEERSCNGSCLYPMQFKCKDSAICVAMENICDEVMDCPFQDDEYFCDTLLNTTCPEKCICLLFVIECDSWKVVQHTFSEVLTSEILNNKQEHFSGHVIFVVLQNHSSSLNGQSGTALQTSASGTHIEELWHLNCPKQALSAQVSSSVPAGQSHFPSHLFFHGMQ